MPVYVRRCLQCHKSAEHFGADIMVSGHTHDAWATDKVKIRCSDQGVVEHRSFWQVKVPTYKDEYGTGTGGWHVATGKPPKPLGAWWLNIELGRAGSPLIRLERAQ